jgi:hypothetical protein
MNKVLCFFLLIQITSGGHAQTTTKEKQAVQHTVEKMFKALGEADTAALKTYVTDDVNFYEYGQVWNLDTLIHKVMLSKAIPDFKRTDRFEFVKTTIQQNTAWVTYYLQSVFIRNGKEEIVNWMETVILINEKKNWKISVLHSTRLSKK